MQEAKDESRIVIAAASFGMGLSMMYIAKSAIAHAEARSSGGGEAGLIWIISAPIFVIGVILVIVGILMGAVLVLRNPDPDEKNE